MTVPVPPPSSRLLRATAAERATVTRGRERLAQQRGRLAAKQRELDDALRAVDERLELLSALGQPPATATSADAVVCEPPTDDRVLRGSAIRETAVRVLLSQPGRIEALHYRDWYELVRQADYAVAGTDPLAVFLTQLYRSPVVRKSTQPGVYEVDRHAAVRIRERLERLAAELRAVTAAAPGPVELAEVRARRRELDLQISRQERALEEAIRTLRPDAQETPGDAAGRAGRSG